MQVEGDEEEDEEDEEWEDGEEEELFSLVKPGCVFADDEDAGGFTVVPHWAAGLSLAFEMENSRSRTRGDHGLLVRKRIER